jgi:hypothetical protein
VVAVRALVPVLVLLGAGCGASPTTPVVPVATSASVSSTTTVPPVATKPAAPLPASGLDADPDADPVRTLVHTWSAALDRHDVEALAALYEEHVRLYGADAPVPWGQVIEGKRRALAGGTFHQEIVGPIDVVHEAGNDFTARFVKRSGSNGRLSDVQARLRVRAKADRQLVIVEESDEPSDALALARRDPYGRCFAVAATAAHGVREVSEFESRALAEADASGGKLHVGGFGPQELGEGKFGFGIGFQSDERFEGHVWYEVDRKTGTIELTIEGTPVPVGESAEARVRVACAGR